MRLPYRLLLLAPLLIGCLEDAERGNPLDPLSDNFENEGAVTGTVTRFNPPFLGIQGASVRLTPLDSGIERLARTDTDGRFTIVDIPPGMYTLSADADGYAATDTTVTVEEATAMEAMLPLDGIPTVEQAVRTERLDRWWPADPLYRLVVDATVGDPDGVADIESVVFTIPDLGFIAPLAVVPGAPEQYVGDFEEAMLPAPLPQLAGLPFRVEATDGAGVTGRAQGVQIVRILQEPPAILSPLPGDTVRVETPVFRWSPLGLAFPIQYRVRLVRLFNGVEVEVWAPADLPLTQTQIAVPSGLLESGGSYYWTVAVVDGFGNLSRSKPAGFSVQL